MTITMNTVKLSRNTFDILKNFATINTNLLVETGNVIKTLSPMKNIMAEATVSEDFDIPFGVWDLNKFLGTISLFDKPELEFEEKYVTINGAGGASVRYHYSDPSLLLTSTKDLNMPESVVEFELTQKQFNEIQKAAAVLQVPDICVRNAGEILQLVALDKADRGSNSYSIDLGELTTSEDFEFYFRVENLKILPGDYQVSITEKIVSEFNHKSVDLKYYIAMESDSHYGE
ncbi:MAG: hypothetical protein H8D80_02580 [Proteobacteria bacterium]|nr:hypothetical protein [Pseudomonadota bacterium]